MSTIKLLDCTLRDGAYLIDKYFGESVISGIINGLVTSGIDIIELGFLQDEGFGKGKPVFKNSIDAESFLQINRGKSEFTAFADYSRYTISNLDDYTGHSFDGVRECFMKDERYKAMDVCRAINEKGYKCYVQPVDVLYYTDFEMLEMIDMVNKIEPYCFSIVDTFGSMYVDDLHRVYSLVNHNLRNTIKIDFHSHNNLQMSSALTQEFISMSRDERDVVVDVTLSGMGRGAGNTPTELIAQYLVSKMHYAYDIDAILDVIDTYIDNLKTRCSWGYSIPTFVAGCFNAHVNNVSYLTKKSTIRSKDLRFILNKIGAIARKHYDYPLLEDTYVKYMESDIDDTKEIKRLKTVFDKKNVLIIAPGKTARTKEHSIEKYQQEHNAIVIAVNFIPEKCKPDYLYLSNIRRYEQMNHLTEFSNIPKIYTSNIGQDIIQPKDYVISFVKLVKCGWEYLDNSVIMLLRLLDLLQIESIGIAGLDGYDYPAENDSNYISKEQEPLDAIKNPMFINKEIAEMLADYIKTRTNKCPISFVTHSRFETVI
jgi:4-hydroxy 2-oxovalerate aldolase